MSSTSAFSWAELRSPEDSSEFRRVLALPRRPSFHPESVAQIVEEQTAKYRLPMGTMTLKPIQAFALHEAERRRGLFASIRVGGGKSLLSYLLAFALGASKAALLVPAPLVSKIVELEYPALGKHWKLPKLGEQLHVVSYGELAHPDTGDVLERLRPDVVIADEAHRLRYLSAAQTRRAARYLRSNKVPFAALTGSPANRSVVEIAPLLELALGDGAPIPLRNAELQRWAGALDASDDPADPGALRALVVGDETPTAAYGRRLAETPGVVLDVGPGVRVALNILARKPQVPDVVQDALNTLRTDWATPDGFFFENPLEFSRYARQIAAGFYYRRTWPNGEPVALREAWLEARNNWFRRVRNYLAAPRVLPDLDSPERLFRAAAEGRWRVEEYAPWAALKDACHPATEAVWLSDFLAEDAVAWGHEHAGIIWCSHSALGAKIAALGQFPYYFDGARDGSALRAETGKRTIIASDHAFKEGSNLQAFSEALVTTPYRNGQKWQQVLGRMHRPEQHSDEVNCWTYAFTPELRATIAAARTDQAFSRDLIRDEQKLLIATYDFLQPEVVACPPAPSHPS